MAKLSAADRRSLPKKDFAVPSKSPGSGSYPIPNKSHAIAAKSMAAQFATPAVKKAVDAKANKMLNKDKKKK